MRPQFRPDIQGLRAVAVMLVAISHAGVTGFDGGYIGVDIFFVISGFLITSGLIGSLDSTGRVSLLDFYDRRARRILPIATVVLVLVVVLSVATVDGVTAADTITDAWWTVLFAANFKFARDGVDYWQSDSVASPLQHYWSLSIEEQFYFIWPLVIVLVALVASRWLRGAHRVRISLGVVMVAAIAASLTWSVISSGSSVAAYFSSFTRFWELGAGALLACIGQANLARRLPAWAQASVATVGLIGIGWATVTFSAETVFPGYAALVPVVGALLVIIGAAAPGPANWLLTRRPATLLGDWSYSIYLWHWPALIFAQYWFGRINQWQGLVAVAVSIAISALSYRFIEEPFRHRRSRHLASLLSNRRGVVLYPLVLALVLPGLVVARSVTYRLHNGTGDPITVTNYGQAPGDPTPDFSADPKIALVQASVLAAQADLPIPAGLRPHPIDAWDERDYGGCNYFDDFVDRLCNGADPDGTRTVVVFGDSHANQWVPAINPGAKANGWKAYYLVRGGCPAVEFPATNRPTRRIQACGAFQDWAVDQIRDLHPDLLVMTAEAARNNGMIPAHTIGPRPSYAEFMRQGTEQMIKRVEGYADRVVWIKDPVESSGSPARCLSDFGASLSGCMGSARQSSRDLGRAQRLGALAAGAEVITMDDYFCAQDLCPAVVGQFVPRMDGGHITLPYAAWLAPVMSRKLQLGSG